jgi:hypothetical protein
MSIFGANAHMRMEWWEQCSFCLPYTATLPYPTPLCPFLQRGISLFKEWTVKPLLLVFCQICDTSNLSRTQTTTKSIVIPVIWVGHRQLQKAWLRDIVNWASYLPNNNIIYNLTLVIYVINVFVTSLVVAKIQIECIGRRGWCMHYVHIMFKEKIMPKTLVPCSLIPILTVTTEIWAVVCEYGA